MIKKLLLLNSINNIIKKFSQVFTSAFAYTHPTSWTNIDNNWQGCGSHATNCGVGWGTSPLLGFTIIVTSAANYSAALRRNYEDYGVNKLKAIDIEYDYVFASDSNGQHGMGFFTNVFPSGCYYGVVQGNGLWFNVDEYYNTLHIDYNYSKLAEVAFTYTTNVWYRIKVRVTKNSIKVKIWLKSGSEPVDWTISYTHSSNFADLSNYIEWFVTASSNGSYWGQIQNVSTKVTR